MQLRRNTNYEGENLKKKDRGRERNLGMSFFAGKTTDALVLLTLTALAVFVLFNAREYLLTKEKLQDQVFVTPRVTQAATEPPKTEPATTPVIPTITPTETEEPWVRPDFAAMREKYNNDEIIAYLDVPDTTIQYFVTQHADNDYYLTHDINKEQSNAGWVFLDNENDINRHDKNTIIYGHNMRSQIMFHDLRKYRDADFAQTHRLLYLTTLYEDFTFEVFSVFLSEAESFMYNLVNIDDETYKDIVDKMLAKSIFDFESEVSVHDRILTLSTCSNVGDERLVVVGKLIKKRVVPTSERIQYD